MPEHQFDSISPSASSLLLTKALTSIPFAREAAMMIWGNAGIENTRKRLLSADFLKRLVHFENRYWSVDRALLETGLKNILEFSSGFSFRGLSWCKDPEVHYIDTDLPGVIDVKKEVVQKLVRQYCTYPADHLSIQALNVMDENAFSAAASRLPAGPVALVNEGLLVYLDEAQKKQLCSIIRRILLQQGGYWISADIYIKGKQELLKDDADQVIREFLATHHVEENKFENFQHAETFFGDCGFAIHGKIQVPPKQLNFLTWSGNGPYPRDPKNYRHIRETWILKAI